MLQGVPGRFLFSRGSEVLNYFSSPEPQSLVHLYLLHSLTPGQLLPPPTGDQNALLVLISPVTQNRTRSAVSWTHCWVWFFGKPGFTPRGCWQWSNFSSFTTKKRERERESKQEDSGSAIEHKSPNNSYFSSLPDPCLPPLCPSIQEKRLVLLQCKGGCPQGVPLKERGWETHKLATCVGLLWNG